MGGVVVIGRSDPYLIADLLWCAEYMGIVLVETPQPGHASESAGSFVSGSDRGHGAPRPYQNV